MKIMMYCYPLHHIVSFTIIGRKHVEYIRKLSLAKVYEIDEQVFPLFNPSIKYDVVLHPHIYIWHRVMQKYYRAVNENVRDRVQQYIDYFKNQFNQIIAVDVCDSDRMSDYAVELLNYADKVIVPSNFCVEVYRSSGVRKPVYRVPHGVDGEWFLTPSIWETSPVRKINPVLIDLYLYKVRRRKRFLLFWLWHSDARKGWPEVKELYSKLSKERNDTVLVLKTMTPNSPAFQEVMHMGAVQVYGWLNDYEKMALYDLTDITLVFSRGGGFELSALESLARGVPCVASYWGSWKDYLPPFLGVKTGDKVKVFEGNAIHVGYGYRIHVEDALNKIHNILENYDDYRARVDEWRQKVLFSEYRWDLIAKKLVDIISNSV
jgi:glycosyltransferase involved in cell wall biosynthesis